MKKNVNSFNWIQLICMENLLVISFLKDIFMIVKFLFELDVELKHLYVLM